MTYEEYNCKKSEYLNIIDDAQNAIKTLIETYINENRRFCYGDKVVITTPSGCSYEHVDSDLFTITPEEKRIAFVNGYNVFDNEIQIDLLKAKKDGTPSKFKDYLSYNETIELYINDKVGS